MWLGILQLKFILGQIEELNSIQMKWKALFWGNILLLLLYITLFKIDLEVFYWNWRKMWKKLFKIRNYSESARAKCSFIFRYTFKVFFTLLNN